MRIALVDRPDAADRPAGDNRFSGIVAVLRAQGHDVQLLNGAPPSAAGTPPILTGLNRALASASLIQANALAHHAADQRFDLVIAPLRGGIAQGLLMARHCGEAYAATRVALWCDTPSADRFLRSDDLPAGIAPLIADALERQAVALADALILSSETKIDLAPLLGTRGVPLFHADLPTFGNGQPLPPRAIQEIVFCGPVRRDAGVVEFIAAIERIAQSGLLVDRTVTFLGPARPSVLGIGSDWLGMRATKWLFPFKVMNLAAPEQWTRYLDGPGRLGVAIADEPDTLMPIRRGSRPHIALLRDPDDAKRLTNRVETALRAALDEGAPVAGPVTAPTPNTDWAALVREIAALPPSAEAPSALCTGPVTVCVVHHNRLAFLADALASIPHLVDGKPVELLIVDNGSDLPFVEEEIRKLAGPRELLNVIRLGQPVTQAHALNLGLAAARHDIVLFLDDDNCFADGGVERLARALAEGGPDIAVTALDIFDDGQPTPAPTAGRQIFLGAAHSAGLFFNAFGDTAMAVRRGAFLRLGGFHDPGFAYPLDWTTLAKAQAAGLRIGALQWPAVRYRRNTARADAAASKLDQEGARSFVFAAYGGTFDQRLLSRYAQKLHLEEP